MKVTLLTVLVTQIGMLTWMLNLCKATELPYSIAWIRQKGSSTRDDCLDMAMDGSGNAFIGGCSRGIIGGDNHGDSDMYLLKYDSNGNSVWSRMLGTTTSEYGGVVAADVDGNAYLAGNTWGDLGRPNNGPPADAVVAKYDAGGNLEWTRQIGTKFNDSYEAVGANEHGDVFAAGYTYGTLDSTNHGLSDAFITKYGADGELAWVRQWGSSGADSSYGVAADQQGGVYMAGQYQTVTGQTTGFLARYSSNGTLLWTSLFGSNNTRALAVNIDNQGNVLVAGDTREDYGGPNAGARDTFLAKYDISGNNLWLRHLGGTGDDYPLDVSADVAGNIYVCGTTSGNLGGQISTGGKDAFVLKYDAVGTLLWTKLIGTSNDDFGCGVAVNCQGAVFAAGYTEGSLGAENAGSTDAFLVKLVPEPSSSILLIMTVLAFLSFRWR